MQVVEYDFENSRCAVFHSVEFFMSWLEFSDETNTVLGSLLLTAAVFVGFEQNF